MRADIRIKKKNQNQKASYNMKSIGYKKKLKLDKTIIFIIGLVFFTGMLVIFSFREDENIAQGISSGNSISTENDNSELQLGEIGDNDTKVEEGQGFEGRGPLTGEEIKIVRSIIDSDTKGLFKLVNKENLLEESYVPDNLVIPNINFVMDRNNDRNLVRAEMVEDLEQMFKDAHEEGLDLFLSNGFRGYNSQESIYSEDSMLTGESSEYVAKPGASEHQLGLAIDITSMNMEFELNESFEDTEEGQWALKNAHKYGFILRYIEGKEDITGYKYEPWHYRYVGDKTISKLCHDKNLTLEELLEYVYGE